MQCVAHESGGLLLRAWRGPFAEPLTADALGALVAGGEQAFYRVIPPSVIGLAIGDQVAHRPIPTRLLRPLPVRWQLMTTPENPTGIVFSLPNTDDEMSRGALLEYDPVLRIDGLPGTEYFAPQAIVERMELGLEPWERIPKPPDPNAPPDMWGGSATFVASFATSRDLDAAVRRLRKLPVLIRVLGPSIFVPADAEDQFFALAYAPEDDVTDEDFAAAVEADGGRVERRGSGREALHRDAVRMYEAVLEMERRAKARHGRS